MKRYIIILVTLVTLGISSKLFAQDQPTNGTIPNNDYAYAGFAYYEFSPNDGYALNIDWLAQNTQITVTIGSTVYTVTTDANGYFWIDPQRLDRPMLLSSQYCATSNRYRPWNPFNPFTCQQLTALGSHRIIAPLIPNRIYLAMIQK